MTPELSQAREATEAQEAKEVASVASVASVVRGACPLDCPDTCSWIVTVKDGNAVALRGDPEHPFTRGSLCNKVAGYLNYARSPDRLLYPLRRVGPKGSGEFIRISWDEALETIAARLLDVINTHGAEAIWPFLGSGSMGLIQGAYGAGRRLWNVLGASRHVQTICTIAGGFGTGYTLGDNRVGMDPETFKFSKLVILWGANVLSTHPHLWRPILEARKNGALVVAIDPIRTRTAAASDWYLAPIPGTDAALALGLLNVVLNEHREDRDFIGERTLGWEAFRERILEFSPSSVAAITGLSAESIVQLGKRLAETRPTGIRIGIGIQRHGGGGMAVRTITCIPGVTGDWRSGRRRALRYARLLRRELVCALARRPQALRLRSGQASADPHVEHVAARRRAARDR